MDGPAPWALGAEPLLGGGAFTVHAAHADDDDDDDTNNKDLADSVPSPDPRGFRLTRAAARVLAWRALLPVLLVLALGALAIGVVCPTADITYATATGGVPACDAGATGIAGVTGVRTSSPASPFLVGQQLGIGLQGIFLIGVLPDVRPAVAVGGHLARLGAGEEGQISARHSRSLRWFARLLSLVAVVMFFVGLIGACKPMLVLARNLVVDVHYHFLWVNEVYHECLWLGTNMCKWPLACAWYVTLKQ
eukprot:COSAG01_NODE_24232_length_786_cov_0.644833_1_plen_248_part_10